MKLANIFSKLKGMFPKVFPYVQRVLDKNDPASFGRFASLLSLFTFIVWDSLYIGIAIHHLTVGHTVVAIADVLPRPEEFYAQAAFVSVFAGGSKLLDAWANRNTSNQ